MKKKLIAAILSVALVASLVPATAFATSDSSADVKSNIAQKQNAQVRAATDLTGLATALVKATDNFPAEVNTVTAAVASPNTLKFVMATSASSDAGYIALPSDNKRLDADAVVPVTFDPSKLTTEITANATKFTVEVFDAADKKISTVTTEGVATGDKVDINITKKANYLTIVSDVAQATPTKVEISGLVYNGDTPAVTNIIKDFAKHYDSSQDAAVKYTDYADMKSVNDKINALTTAQETDLNSDAVGVTGGPLTHFKSAFALVDGWHDDVMALEKGIKEIPSGILTIKDIATYNPVKSKYDALKNKQNSSSQTIWGAADPNNGIYKKDNTTLDAVLGASLVRSYEDAGKVIAVVEAIEDMEPVTGSNHTNYAAQTNVAIATGLINGLNPSTLVARVGNMDTYNDNLKKAKNAEALIADADAAIANAVKASKPAVPYTDAQVKAAEAALAKAEAAVKAVGKDLAGAKWSTWQTSIGTPKNGATPATGLYKAIDGLKETIKTDEAIQPFLKLLGNMPDATKLTWANKDAMFQLAKTFGELSVDEQNHFNAEYTAESKKYDNLKAQQVAIEKGNLAAATARLATMIDALPATVTLNNEDAVNDVAFAIQQYKTGDLRNASDVYTNLTAAAKDKADAAIKALKALTDVRDKEDQAKVEPFKTSMKAISAKLTAGTLNLSDKAFVKNARAAYDALTDSQKKLVKDEFKDLEKAEQIISDLEAGKDPQTLANELTVAIGNLPAAKDVKIEQAADIFALNEKYMEAIKVEGVEAKLSAADKEKLFAVVAKAMELKIGALPTLKADGTDSKEDIDKAAVAIKEARTIFDKLNSDEQKLVPNKGKLTDAEVALSTATVKHVDAQLSEIAKIDFTKELTAEQIALIKDEKTCIEALSDAEKAKLNADNLKIFTDTALKALEEQENAGKTIDKIEGLKNVVYTGKSQTPAIKVIGKDGKEIAADNYTVKFYSNKNVGEATVLVKAKADSGFTGEAEATFIITPAKASITSLQVAKAKLRVNIKPMSGVNYRIAYKPTSAKSYKGQNTSLTSKVLPGIKAKTKYTVKVRAYIKEGGKTYFGAYSPIKHATTK